MGIFSRIKNIVKSNLNFEKEIQIDSEFEDSVLNKKVRYENSSNYNETNEEISTPKTLEEECYAVLELEYGASFDKIKSAYRKLLKKYHPDLYQNNPEKLKIAIDLTKKINDAYNYFEEKFK